MTRRQCRGYLVRLLRPLQDSIAANHTQTMRELDRLEQNLPQLPHDASDAEQKAQQWHRFRIEERRKQAMLEFTRHNSAMTVTYDMRFAEWVCQSRSLKKAQRESKAKRNARAATKRQRLVESQNTEAGTSLIKALQGYPEEEVTEEVQDWEKQAIHYGQKIMDI